MPFWRTRLSAKRFIAGVGGCAAAPLPTPAPSKENSSDGGAALELADNALGDIAHGERGPEGDVSDRTSRMSLTNSWSKLFLEATRLR